MYTLSMNWALSYFPGLWNCLMTDSLIETMVAYETWSPHCHGGSYPRYIPSTRCDYPSGGLAAYRVESVTWKDRNSKLHVC